MTIAVILDDFRGSGALAGSSPATLTGVTSAGWSSIEGGFTRTSTGTTVLMGTFKSATLDMDGSTPLHTSAGGGVTVLEVRMLPGGLADISFDYESDYAGITVQAGGSARAVEGAFQTAHNFTATAPGSGLVTVRIEVTTSAMRFYVNNVLGYTRGTGVPPNTPITMLRVGYPGYLGTDGYTSGTSPVALDYLHLKTEVSSGPLGSGAPSQPAPGADANPKVLFADTFATAMNLNGSHGETGPLASVTWACIEYLDETYSPPRAEAAEHWTRGGSSGLTVRGRVRAPEELALAAECRAGTLAERITSLPIIVQATITSDIDAIDYVTVSASAVSTGGAGFAGWGFTAWWDGSMSLFWNVPGLGSFAEHYAVLPFAFVPASIGAGGRLIRAELWEGELRLYVAGTLVGTLTGLQTEYMQLDADNVELIGWGIGTRPYGATTPLFITPTPILKDFKLLGADPSTGEIPAPVDTESLINPPGPGNEPSPSAPPFTSFWTAFRGVYETP